jgi:AraC family transcriptional regulator
VRVFFASAILWWAHLKKSLYLDTQFSVIHSVTSSAIPLHAHSEYVVGYYFSGRCQCRLGSRAVLEFKRGDAGLLNPGDAHEDLETIGARDYLTVNLRKEFFQEIIQGLGCSSRQIPHFPAAKLKADPLIKRLFEALKTEVNTQEFGREVLLRSLVTELAVHLFRQFSPSAIPYEKYPQDQNTARWQVRRSLDYLHDNFSRDFSLESIAAAANLSKFYLERVFKKATGLSPHSYMLMLRVERAKQLLSSSPNPIVEIAMELGFSDQSHFTNVFKRMTGFTPNAYRLGAN